MVTNEKKIVALASRNDSLWHFVLVNRADVDQYVKMVFTGLPRQISSSTIFNNSENQPTGGIVEKIFNYSQLTDPKGFLLKAGSIAVFTLNIRSITKTTGTSGFIDNLQNDFLLFPNPANQFVQIQYKTGKPRILSSDLHRRFRGLQPVHHVCSGISPLSQLRFYKWYLHRPAIVPVRHVWKEDRRLVS